MGFGEDLSVRKGLTARMAVIVLTVGLAAFRLAAQTASPTPAPTPLMPAINELGRVSIGMTVDEVKDKIGKAKVSDKTGMFYDISKGVTMQIGLDPAKKVRTIAMIYSGRDADPPKFEDILGPDVPMVTKKDGSIYKLVRYRASGFWVAYSRTAGNNPMTIVTMRKIQR